MTQFSLFVRRLCVVLLIAAGASALMLPAVTAEELVGTPVPVGSDPMSVAVPAPTPNVPAGEPEDMMSVEDGAMFEPAHPESPVLGMAPIQIPPIPALPSSPRIERGFDYSQLVPITAILMIFGAPMVLLGYLGRLHFQAKALRRRDMNANIDKLLAAGRDIPVELLRGDDPRQSDEGGNRNKGVRNLLLGIGGLIFLTIFLGIKIGSIGFIWIALGLSQLIIWKLNNGDRAQLQADKQG